MTKVQPLDLMTAVPIASNQFWCENCSRYFSSPYNLSRHQKQTANACRPDATKITPRKIVDALTGQLRYRTADEQRELARMRKVERYWDTMSAERIRKIRGERPRAPSRPKEKETHTTDRRANDTRTLPVDAKRRHWAAVLREAKKRWGEDRIQEQAQLLAAHHNVGSMRVPGWVKRDIYTYMDRMYRQAGLWVPEEGIFWVSTEDGRKSDEGSTGHHEPEGDPGELEDG